MPLRASPPLPAPLAALLPLVLLPAPPAAAQSAPGAEVEVMRVVERLFDGMRARDGEAVASVFHPEARMVTTGSDPDGGPRVVVQGVDGFVAAVGEGGVPWNEPLFATRIQVDANLAHVWTFYRFYAGDRFSHCGYNSIRLVRTAEGWQIIDLADTRRGGTCEPPEGTGGGAE